MKLYAITLIVAFAPAAWTDATKLTFKTADTEYTVSFDPSQISESRMRELIVLSPFVLEYMAPAVPRDFRALGSTIGERIDKSLVALPLEQCLGSDPSYSDCSSDDVSSANFAHNAEVNLQKSKRGLAWLQHVEYPKELQPVVKFLLDGLALSIWVEETRFKYYSTWNESVLKEVHDGIDPVQICPEAFRKLGASTSKQEKYRIARFDWANCMVKAISRRLGSYPVTSWNDFLKSHGITEHYEQKGPD